MRDLVQLLPMLDELCVLGLSGAQLHNALENGVSQVKHMYIYTYTHTHARARAAVTACLILDRFCFLSCRMGLIT